MKCSGIHARNIENASTTALFAINPFKHVGTMDLASQSSDICDTDSVSEPKVNISCIVGPAAGEDVYTKNLTATRMPKGGLSDVQVDAYECGSAFRYPTVTQGYRTGACLTIRWMHKSLWGRL